MRLHILVRKGVLGFALALTGLVVSTAAAQAQDKEPAKDTAKAEKQVKRQCRKKNTKQANKTHKPKICPFCVPGGDSVEADQHSVLIAITIPGSI